MRSSTSFAIAAIAGLAAASPRPQELDFAALADAPEVATGPTGAAIVQDVTVSTTVPVSTVATAASTATAAAKRDVEKRTSGLTDYFFFKGLECEIYHNCGDSKSAGNGWGCDKPTNTVNTWSYYTTSAAATSAPVAATTSNTPTTASSSSTACPTTIEDGTYCGFINPEDPCAPQPGGYGPVPTPDTVDAFYSYAPYHSMASAAATVVPSVNNTQYTQVFKDLNAAVSANSYLGLYTLTSYSPADCAAHCDATDLCTSFNLYIERDPSQNPTNNDSTAATVWGYDCPNPASIANYKCTLWGSNLDSSVATNEGDYREQFQVVITGSDAWDKTNVTTPTCSVPAAAATTSAVPAPTLKSGTNCGGKAISAPSHWMGSKFIPGPFNAQVCANYALEQNEFNRQAAKKKGSKSFTPCQMFNSYYLHKNGEPYGTYCSLYATSLETKYATYKGGKSGNDNYNCEQSFTFEFSYQKSYYSW